MKNNKRYLDRDKNAFSAILETLIAVGISVTLLTIFFYSTATLYTVQDKPEADVAARAVGVMETLIGSTGQDASAYPGWEDQPLPNIPEALGLGTSPTVEYGILSYNTTTKKTNITCRYGASPSIGVAEACFLAGTKIVMADSSYKNIEDIKIGDIVKSYDVEKNTIVDGKVSCVYHHTPEEMTDHYLMINNQLRVTPNHQFYSDGRWVEAGELKTGDSLFYQGSDYEIYSIKRVFEKTYTYNFEVEGCHNYFVALKDKDTLVHNAPRPTPPVAHAGGPYYGQPNKAVVFDASGSTGTITSYKWDFGDGTFAYGMVVQKNYSSVRNYKVNLTVTGSGYQDIDRTTAYISYVPHAEFEGFDKDGLKSGAFVYLNAEKSSGNIVTYHWTAVNQIGVKILDINVTSPYKTCNFFSTGVYSVTLNTTNATHYSTFTDTIYVNQLEIPGPTAEPWVLASKNIYPEDEDASFLSYGSNYYVKYVDLPSSPTLIYKRFEVKQKTSTSTPILDIDKITRLGEFNYLKPEDYDTIRETLGLLTDQVSYNFNVTITYNEINGSTVNVYFGPSYQNIAGGVREEVTRQIYIYNPPKAEGVWPDFVITKSPYYLIGEITIHIFLGGQF